MNSCRKKGDKLPAPNSSKGPLIFACFPSSSTRLHLLHLHHQLRQPILSKVLIISTFPELVSRLI